MFERVVGMIGQNNFDSLQSKTICIIGLGGVGGSVVDALVRSGILSFIIVDYDLVEESNLNRQILYRLNDVGMEKVDCTKKHILSINPNCHVIEVKDKITSSNISTILSKYQIDYIIDAIDDIDGKVAITTYAIKNHIDFIVSLGTANKLNSSQIEITKLNKTTVDPLAKKFRYTLKKYGVDISSVRVAFSSEKNEKISKTSLNSMYFVPNCTGIKIAEYVLLDLLKKQ